MLPAPNYSDFYKFCTSFGLLLIIASVAIYVFYVNTGFNSVETFLVKYSPEKLSQEGYSNETIQSIQNFYGAKLNIFTRGLLLIVPILSLVMLIGGTFLFFSGFFNWRKKQKKQDIQDNRISLEAEIEIRRLKAKQVYEKQLSERYQVYTENGK